MAMANKPSTGGELVSKRSRMQVFSETTYQHNLLLWPLSDIAVSITSDKNILVVKKTNLKVR